MIEEVLDMDLIKQKLNNNAFELETYSSFIIDSMAKLCSPMRDDQVASLRQLRDVVPLYQYVYHDFIIVVSIDIPFFQRDLQSFGVDETRLCQLPYWGHF